MQAPEAEAATTQRLGKKKGGAKQAQKVSVVQPKSHVSCYALWQLCLADVQGDLEPEVDRCTVAYVDLL